MFLQGVTGILRVCEEGFDWLALRTATYLLVLFAMVSSILLVKKRENMPYMLTGEMFVGRLGFERRSVIITGLNVCAGSSIGSLFGCLVP